VKTSTKVLCSNRTSRIIYCMVQPRDLPKDLDSLTALVIEQQVSLKAKDFEIEHLRPQVARLRNLKFGQSSERFEGTVDQLHLAKAVASMPQGMLAGLMRRNGESWGELLLRLDAAVVQSVVENRVINDLQR